MDLTMRRDSKEALFVDIMTAADKSESCTVENSLAVPDGNCKEPAVDVDLLRKKAEKAGRHSGAISPKKLRPQSMITLPSSNGSGDMLGISLNSFMGKGLFRPKAFFSSEQQLAERVEEYNKRKRDDNFKLKLVSTTSQEDICSGLLKFHYSDGLDTFTENMPVQSRSTVEEILPNLITTFLPHEYQMAAIDGTQPTTVSLVQGKMERDLDVHEKPLEIVLDCSSRGLATPKFLFKCPLPTVGIPLTPHRTSRGVRPGGLELSSEYGHNLSQPEHHTSMSSLGSGVSISSSRSGKSKSTSSLTPRHKKKKTIPQYHQHQSGGAAPSPSATPSSLARLQLSIHNDAPSPLTSSKASKSKVSSFFSRSLRGRKKSKPVPLESDSPPNSILQDSNDEREEEDEAEDDDEYYNGPISFAADSSSSPRPNLERTFTLSTVMHIYFVEGKQAQVYKSVLVSEKATTKELIEQALERYNMKKEDPDNFALFDVIGKWHDVTNTLKNQPRLTGNGRSKVGGGVRRRSGNTTSTLPNMNILNASPLVQHRAAVEEFVVCYSRELEPNESPYKMQFYLTAQEGFSRRFELRSKTNTHRRMRKHFHEKSHSVDIMERPDEATPTPDILEVGDEEEELKRGGGIFGDTVHRKRAKRNRMMQHPSSVDSADPETSITILDPAEDESETVSRVDRRKDLRSVYSSKTKVIRGSLRAVQTDDPEDLEIPISINTSFAPNFSKLGCSSPDSGVEFQKGPQTCNSIKSSVSSEQSDSGNAAAAAANVGKVPPQSGLYPGSLDSAFLLSLRLHDPHRESLFYNLSQDLVEVTAASSDSPKAEEATAKGNILLSSGRSENKKHRVLCSICRHPVSDSSFCNLSEENLSGVDSPGLCYEYSLLGGQSDLYIYHNGELVTDSTTLRPGDLIAVGNTYLFMFQDYSDASKSCSNYSWRPQVCLTGHREEERRKSSSSRETLVDAATKSSKDTENFSCRVEQSGVAGDPNLVYHNPPSEHIQVLEKSSIRRVDSPSATRVNYRVDNLQEAQKITTVVTAIHAESPAAIQSSSQSSSLSSSTTRPNTAKVTRVPITASDSEPDVVQHSPVSAQFSLSAMAGKKKEPHSPLGSHENRVDKLKAGHKALGKARSLPLPKDRKLVFSFKVTEEDKLLKHVISESRSGTDSCLRHSPCKLAPAYILAMCTEYCSMTSGPQAVARFVQKATDRIQEVVWECTNRLSTWQPSVEALQKPLHQKQELFPLLEPVFFWLANALEYYNFLDLQASSLQLDKSFSSSDKTKKDKRKAGGKQAEEEDDEKPTEILYSILVYIYQQAFYPISKVLYQSLPLMLESCADQHEDEPAILNSSPKPIVIGQAVEFLQALLDMMTEQNIHLEVISQFFANIFFFVNAAMFNALMEQGSELGLFQHYSGLILRGNLDLLEGWACQVGFKDAVLRYLARFSGAIDLLATPSDKLLQLNWMELGDEFPVLHPAQLHYLLSQYLLPVPNAGVPRHWTPSQEDACLALSRDSLMESFDGHPGFHLPSSNYVLDLNTPPPESEYFQEALEALHTSLYKNGQSTGGMTTNVLSNGGTISIDRTSPTPPDQPSSSSRKIKRRDTEPGSDKSSSFQRTLRESSLNSSTESQEDLLTVSWRNLENSQQLDRQNSKSPTTSSSQSRKGRHRGQERVKTAKADKSTPRTTKTELTSSKVYPSASHNEAPQPRGWSENQWPQGARTVTIPRGDNGFGLLVAEKKVVGGVSRLLVQQLLPGSMACKVSGLAVGDHVVAIEGQPLRGADYHTAQKYLKDAEDEISITLAPRTNS